MQKINQLVKNNNLGHESVTSTTPTGKIDHNVKILINMVFARFQAIYGNRFDQMFADDEILMRAKREWALSLRDLTEKQILQAIEVSKQQCTWPPSIAEFLQFSKASPQSLGLPSTKQAYHEAVSCRQDPAEFDWQHPIVYWAAHRTGFQTLKIETEKKSFALFEKHYLELVEQVQRGANFDLPQQRFITQQTSNSTLAIEATAKELGLDAKLAWKLLIYMEKPLGSAARQAYRKNAVQKAAELGLTIQLPE